MFANPERPPMHLPKDLKQDCYCYFPDSVPKLKSRRSTELLYLKPQAWHRSKQLHAIMQHWQMVTVSVVPKIMAQWEDCCLLRFVD